MELMSPLLLCTLLVLFPQGKSNSTEKEMMDSSPNITANDTIDKKRFTYKEPDLNLSKLSELQSLLSNVNCHDCVDCIERAITAQSKELSNNRSKYFEDESKTKFIDHEQNAFKDKRHAAANARRSEGKSRRKMKKNKYPKSVSVIKYSIDDEVYALKINEIKMKVTGEFNDTTLTTSLCQVYQVKKSATCNTPESELLLALAKKRANKRKDNKHRVGSRATVAPPSTDKPYAGMPSLSYLLKKRELDPEEQFENIMPSVEDSFSY